VIRKPPEAARHHIFIAGEPFAGAQRGPPFALQNRDIIERFRIDFSGLLLGNHHIPRSEHLSAAVSNAGHRLMGCRKCEGRLRDAR
jgi:carboxypeptidase C (cathepsin A)